MLKSEKRGTFLFLIWFVCPTCSWETLNIPISSWGNDLFGGPWVRSHSDFLIFSSLWQSQAEAHIGITIPEIKHAYLFITKVLEEIITDFTMQQHVLIFVLLIHFIKVHLNQKLYMERWHPYVIFWFLFSIIFILFFDIL